MNNLVEQLKSLGVQKNNIILVHASFKSLGISNPEDIIQSLLYVIGDYGTLLMPGLSYLQIPHNIHNTNNTPSCVGFLSEYFRKRPGTKRSIHPTHSVCGIGENTHSILDGHIFDTTPCGQNSPFNKLSMLNGKIIFLGCGLRPNTSMHAIEEYIQPPYLFGPPLIYTITDSNNITFTKKYITHNFRGYIQRYDRILDFFTEIKIKKGMIGKSESFVIESGSLFEKALNILKKDPLFFVDKEEE